MDGVEAIAFIDRRSGFILHVVSVEPKQKHEHWLKFKSFFSMFIITGEPSNHPASCMFTVTQHGWWQNLWIKAQVFIRFQHPACLQNFSFSLCATLVVIAFNIDTNLATIFVILFPFSGLVFVCSRRMRWAGHVARMGETRNAYRVLVGKPEGKRPLGRPRRRWVDNIKMDLRDRMRWYGLDWRIGTNGGFLWTRWWTFGLLKMLGSCWVAAQLAASQEGLSSVSK
jgi:hypothetical protein